MTVAKRGGNNENLPIKYGKKKAIADFDIETGGLWFKVCELNLFME